MTAIANTQQDRNALRHVKTMVNLAFLAALISAAAGVVLWLADPAAGTTTEAALGFTAAISGLGAAAATITAAVYMQAKGLWKYAPTWIRTSIMLLVAIGIVVTVTGWFEPLFG